MRASIFQERVRQIAEREKAATIETVVFGAAYAPDHQEAGPLRFVALLAKNLGSKDDSLIRLTAANASTPALDRADIPTSDCLIDRDTVIVPADSPEDVLCITELPEDISHIGRLAILEEFDPIEIRM